MNIIIIVLIYLLVFLVIFVFLYIQLFEADRQQKANSIREVHDYLQSKNTDGSKLSNIPIYIHTIPRLTERQDRMRKQMDRLDYTNYKFYYGIDKNEMNLDIWTLPDGIRRTIKVPTKERKVLVAHTLSMLGLMQTFYDSNESYMLLLEDDASLCTLPGWDMSIQEMIDQAPSDWGILSLIPHSDNGKPKEKYTKYNGYSCAAWIFKREAAKAILDKIVSNTDIDLFKFGHDIVADMSFPRIVNTYALDKFYVIDYNLDDTNENMINPGYVWQKFTGWEDDLLSIYNSVYLRNKTMGNTT